MLGYRKFIVAETAIVLSAALCWAGRVGAETYGEVIGWVAGSYIAGNAVSKFAEFLELRVKAPKSEGENG